MRRLWLIFAQAVTLSVAGLFTYHALLPLWQSSTAPGSLGGVVAIQEARPPLLSGPGAEQRADGYRAAAQQALPAVVYIYTSQEVSTPRNPLLNDPFFRHFLGETPEARPQRRQGLGSGVIVSADGYILTNNHVIDGADDIEVATQDGKKHKAHIVGGDPDSDLAVLRINLDPAIKLPTATFAPPGSLRVGDIVLAIGNPFGVGQTMTHGIVSALGRTHLGINTFEDFIQTDAAINPGNSGGALVDVRGHLVGINTAIYSQNGGSMGIGFAIPVSLVRSVMEQIIRNGAVTRGWIGVEVQEVTPELAESFKLPNTEGTLIAGVMRSGPADTAGIRPGDILLSVAGKTIADPQSMLEQVASQTPGQHVRIQFWRAGKEYSTMVQVARRPTPNRKE